jgi:hypothetical protein
MTGEKYLMSKIELNIPTKKSANLVQFTLNNYSASPISVDFGNNFPLANVPTTPNYLIANSNVSSFNSGAKNVNSALNTNNYTLYVANDSTSVVVYSIETNTAITTILLTEPQAGIFYVPLNNCVYVTGSVSLDTYVIDCFTNTIIATIVGADIGFSMFFNTNNNLLYGLGSSTLFVINVLSNTIATSIIGLAGCVGITINLASNLAYITDTINDNILIIDCTNNVLLADFITLNPASAPQNIIYNKNNNLLYIANSGSSSVAVCDVKSNSFLYDIPLIPNTQPLVPFDLVLNETTNSLFITSQGFDEQYSVVDCNTNVFEQTILISSATNQLNGIILNRESNILYISGSTSNNLYGFNAISTPQNTYYVDGSVDYNFFIQNLYYEPIKVNYIRISLENSSLKAQKSFYNNMEIVEISATGESETYSYLPISHLDVSILKNIILIPFNNLIMDGRKYLSNYIINPYSVITFNVYFNQLNRGSIEFYPHLYQPKKQLKDFIKAFN